jgi:hypothetical protein
MTVCVQQERRWNPSTKFPSLQQPVLSYGEANEPCDVAKTGMSSGKTEWVCPCTEDCLDTGARQLSPPVELLLIAV